MATNAGPRGPRSHPRAPAYALLGFLSVIWGLAFVAIRVADSDLSPLSLLLIRWLIASAGLAIIVPFARPKTKFQSRDLPRPLAFALMMVALYGTALNYAETSISSGLVGLLVSLGPVFIVAFSAVTLKERLSRRLVYALLLALVGCVLLSASDLNAGGNSLSGALEAIVASLIYAGFTVLSKPLVDKYGALSVTIWGSLTGTVFLLPLASAEFVRQVSALPAEGWVAVGIVRTRSER